MTTLGLRQNWKQFTLLVIINAFVGAMVGLERTILPDLAESEFGITAATAVLSFIVVFGITKAITNYYMGAMADRIGRKKLLVIGWLFAIPVPLILLYATSWSFVVMANVLLGINQGLCWSSTVVMKIDLAGPRQRGLAMGLNESAGYLAVGLMAFLTGWMASQWGLKPTPFLLGLGVAITGFWLSLLLVRDTRGHVEAEANTSDTPPLKKIFWETTWRHESLGSITQAGMANNLNDGMMWGLLPMLLAAHGYTLEAIGLIVAVYPAVWGLGQIVTGPMADRFSKKKILFFGMALQGLVILCFAYADQQSIFILLSVLLGIGTALVYPTFLAAISDYTPPDQRAASIGVFRLWRDLGYAVGAILTGFIADWLGIESAFIAIGIITLLSATIIAARMKA